MREIDRSRLAKGLEKQEFPPRVHANRQLFQNPRLRMLAVAILLGGILAAAIGWKLGFDFAVLKRLWSTANAYLVSHPSALFWALVILPGLPVPTSALLFIAGVVWRQEPVIACLLSLSALALNLTWTYWLAAGPARGRVLKMLEAAGIRIPVLPAGDRLRWILIMRLTPGFPLFLQNYLLGFLRVPFKLYLGVSMLCTGVIGVGVVLGGAGFADGKLAPALTGLSLIVVGVVLAQLLRQKLAGRKRCDQSLDSPGMR